MRLLFLLCFLVAAVFACGEATEDKKDETTQNAHVVDVCNLVKKSGIRTSRFASECIKYEIRWNKETGLMHYKLRDEFDISYPVDFIDMLELLDANQVYFV